MSPVGKDTRTFVSGEIKEAIEASSWRWKAIDTAVKIAMPILLSACGWLFFDLQAAKDARASLERRISLIEATRYTRDDAQGERDGVRDALNEIKVILARQEASVAEVKAAVQKLEKRLDSR